MVEADLHFVVQAALRLVVEADLHFVVQVDLRLVVEADLQVGLKPAHERQFFGAQSGERSHPLPPG